jgi:DNA polymerase/3'-5' exonuclease PolX
VKGKRKFTKDEAERIQSLLRKKCRAARAQQKSIRGKLRRMRFYITDWDDSYSGFTPADFDHLVKSRQIIIVDN